MPFAIFVLRIATAGIAVGEDERCASIVAAAVPNLVVIVFDNGVYEVTGQQPTAGASAARGGTRSVDFAAIARACGSSLS